eukprot:4455740-Pleurochrysis_carterae.AAC.1
MQAQLPLTQNNRCYAENSFARASPHVSDTICARQEEGLGSKINRHFALQQPQRLSHRPTIHATAHSARRSQSQSPTPIFSARALSKETAHNNVPRQYCPHLWELMLQRVWREKCLVHAMRVQWRRAASRNGGRTFVLCTSGEEWRREKHASRMAGSTTLTRAPCKLQQ